MIREDDFLDSFFDFKFYVINMNKDFYKKRKNILEEEKKGNIDDFISSSSNITGKILNLIKNIPKNIVYSNLPSIKTKKEIVFDIDRNSLFLYYVVSMIKNHYIKKVGK